MTAEHFSQAWKRFAPLSFAKSLSVRAAVYQGDTWVLNHHRFMAQHTLPESIKKVKKYAIQRCQCCRWLKTQSVLKKIAWENCKGVPWVGGCLIDFCKVAQQQKLYFTFTEVLSKHSQILKVIKQAITSASIREAVWLIWESTSLMS